MCNNVQVYPTGSAGNVVFTGLLTPSSSTTPTAYAWYVDICANNVAGTTHGISIVYAPPTAITSVTLSNAGVGVFDVTWVGGLGNSVTYLYDVSSSGAIITPAGNYTTSVLTASSTRITLTNTAQKTYTVVVKATNVGGTVSSGTSGSVTTLSPYTIPVTGYTFNGSAVTTPSGALSTGNGIIKGTSTTGGTNYNVYAFGQGRNTSDAGTTNNYVMSYNVASSTTVYVLAVGGGGGSITVQPEEVEVVVFIVFRFQ